MPAEKRKLESRDAAGKQKKKFHYDPAGKLTPGARGCFVTCARGREPPATKDVLAMFEHHLERHPELAAAADAQTEADQDAADADAGIDVEDEVANELRALQEQGKPRTGGASTKPFEALKTEVECVLFIKFRKDIDPRPFVHALFADKLAAPSAVSAGRFVHKLTPIIASSDASTDGLKRALARALPQVFSRERPLKYRIDCDVRFNDTVTRNGMIPVAAEMVRTFGAHEVDLTDYDVNVNITVTRSYLGVGCLFDCARFKRYNIAELHSSLLPSDRRPPRPGRDRSGVTAAGTDAAIPADVAAQPAALALARDDTMTSV